jgi:hypothetical protein
MREKQGKWFFSQLQFHMDDYRVYRPCAQITRAGGSSLLFFAANNPSATYFQECSAQARKWFLHFELLLEKLFCEMVSKSAPRKNRGKAPATGCDAQHSGAEVRAAYTAEYIFYVPN